MSLMRNPVIRRVIVSDLVSRLGSRMSYLALPWFVLVTTGSATRMGLTFGVELLPVAILGIPSAKVISRLGVRLTVVSGDAAQFILIGLLPALYELKVLSFWIILVVVGAAGTVSAPYFAAQRLLLPECIGDEDEKLLTAGMAIVEGSTWGSQLVGPVLAGVLIAAIGPLNVLWVDAATYAFSAVLLYGLPRPVTGSPSGSYDPGLLAGARYALRDRVLARLITAATGYGVFIPFILMALPLLADTRFHGDPRVAGALLGAWGGGAFLGTFAVMPALKRASPMRLGAIGGIAMAIPLWFIWINQPAVSLGVIMAVSGLFVPMLNAPGFAILTSRPPVELRAQVMTFFVSANTIAGPVAYVVAGVLFAKLGARPVLIAVGIGVTLCAGVLVSFLRQGGAPERAEEKCQLQPEGRAT
jgi:MFS family permease